MNRLDDDGWVKVVCAPCSLVVRFPDNQRLESELWRDHADGIVDRVGSHRNGLIRTVHEDLEITKADWGTAVKYLVTTIEEHRVPVQEKDELLAIVSSLENDIVTQD